MCQKDGNSRGSREQNGGLHDVFEVEFSLTTEGREQTRRFFSLLLLFDDGTPGEAPVMNIIIVVRHSADLKTNAYTQTGLIFHF